VSFVFALSDSACVLCSQLQQDCNARNASVYTTQALTAIASAAGACCVCRGGEGVGGIDLSQKENAKLKLWIKTSTVYLFCVCLTERRRTRKKERACAAVLFGWPSTIEWCDVH